jgi:hypothetical protein
MISPTMPNTESIIPKDLFSIFLKKQRICRYNVGANGKVPSCLMCHLQFVAASLLPVQNQMTEFIHAEQNNQPPGNNLGLCMIGMR